MDTRLHNRSQSASGTVAVIGGGVAGMSAACALGEAGYRVQLIERRGYLGGRASSYLHPGVNEVIDNCQHALIGAYTNLIAFYQRIGVADKIHWTTNYTMIEPGGRRSSLGASWLPAPLHGLPKLLSCGAFTAGDKVSLVRAFTAILLGSGNDPHESLGAWLRRQGQSKGAMERFWRLVIASALNSDIDQIGVNYASMVIRGLFMDSAQAGAMGMSTVPLSQLYAGVPEFLSARGGRVSLNANVERLLWDQSSKQWSLSIRGEDAELRCDFVVLALPFEGCAKLLPLLPAVEGKEKLTQQVESHTHWPICSAHLWFDREITDLDHAVLLDRELHWMYNQSKLQRRPGNYIELVQSASRAYAALPREEALAQAVGEVGEFFPEARSARVVKAALIKEVRATFGVPPGVDSARPSARSPWPNLFLAGDWIATGWPSTMESAARSGHIAADELCAQSGGTGRFLTPDLKPQGLMRFLSL
ncbi:hydroxysqualene dehydroxylase HpnE [Occallatibacter savannae]|uniref:hydroxysqualene dehydroxylase HpnE n=1 Tax=Occallatibacter savannae TaxID=1002691 RepID=UPI0023B8094C|nr:hydroxysqualene dehydroxylase HpnE [Occallatibacter savannae]